LKNIIKNLIAGLCFGIGLLTIIYIADKTEVFEDDSQFSESDQHITSSVKAAIEDIAQLDIDNCASIEGAWEGQREENDGGLRTWFMEYKLDGVFNGRVTFTSPDTSSSNKQIGTWECINSVLFTTVQKEKRTQMFNYLILSSHNDTKILSNIGRHSYPRTYIYKKVQP
jgi:hypothetical protein